MEKLHSRQSALIRRLRLLARDGALRREAGLILCDGQKLLGEAIRSGAEIRQVLWKETRPNDAPDFPEEYLLDEALFDYVSPMKNSPGPLFTVAMKPVALPDRVRCALLLEGVQDPGNVGTVLRTADAFGIDVVILLDGCADPWSPKTVRAGMGAVFRQAVLTMSRDDAVDFCRTRGLTLFGAALSPKAKDLRTLSLNHAAVAIGSEGRGLSRELLQACDGEIIIPMSGEAESLNAAVAASVVMWEMCRAEEVGI